MTRPHDPLLSTLDRVDAPVTFFIRDDDVGWADERLLALLQLTNRVSIPIDLAAIPTAVTPFLAAELNSRRDDGQRIGIHQHGYAHLNHEPSGRKSEFGVTRDPGRRRRDIARGRDLLRAAFDERLDPIFTPPWNRVSPDTPAVLAGLGFAALSRDATAADQADLPELTVHADWTKQWRRATEEGMDPAQAIALELARRATAGSRVGLMLHHAVMEPAEFRQLECCLLAWRAHPMARWTSMTELLHVADTPETAG